MRAALGNFSIFHNENLVGLLDGGQAVGNRDDRLAARKLRNGLLDEVLVFGVDARGRLIEDDNGCVFENRPARWTRPDSPFRETRPLRRR